MFVEFKPLPYVDFTPDSKITCIGSPIKDHNDVTVGAIIDYRIVNGELICRAEIWDDSTKTNFEI